MQSRPVQSRPVQSRPVRIANASGFYGDRLSAAREMVTGGPIDVLTGDYLAELTMSVLWRQRRTDPTTGYARTFLQQLEQVLPRCRELGVRVVSNAGGLAPASLAEQVRSLGHRLGVDVAVAYVDGDDVSDVLAGRSPGLLTANAYLGCFGVAAALRAGADVVVTGRVADAALAMGPAAWWHGWGPDDLKQLAGAAAAGHVLECGAQATGGNYPFFTEVPGLSHVGFPLAEVAADGSAVITKHPGTGGLIDVGTVTAQLLYEVAGPRYPTPDVTVRLDTVRLRADGPDRVRIDGVRGEPPPATTKVALTRLAGWRNQVTFLLTGCEMAAKAAAIRHAVEAQWGDRRPSTVDWRLVRADRPDPADNAEAVALLTVQVQDPNEDVVGRRFAAACVELVLASVPGLTVTGPPTAGTPYAAFEPAYLPNAAIAHQAHLPDGSTCDIPPPVGATALPALDHPPPPPRPPGGPRRPVPLGAVFGARSGDKGGDANVGVWARDDAGYAWLAHELTTDAVRRLLPEAAGLPIHRYLFANLRAVNFVLVGLLGAGAAANTRLDPQAKGLAEWLRARVVELPVALLDPPSARRS